MLSITLEVIDDQNHATYFVDGLLDLVILKASLHE